MFFDLVLDLEQALWCTILITEREYLMLAGSSWDCRRVRDREMKGKAEKEEAG
jgi:hypothetical protein